MLWSIIADGAFACAVFIETLAALSLIKIIYSAPLREEFDPIMLFYKRHISSFADLPARLLPTDMARWYPDAYVIGAALFFLFFIAQAKKAAAPHEIPAALTASAYKPALHEAVIDAALPIVFCVIGALLAGLTLLPLLTPVLGLWLLARKLNGKPFWFEVSRSYYVNLLLVAGLTISVLLLPT